MLAPQEQPDFAAMHAAIAAAGRDAINRVGEPDAGKRLVDQFVSAIDELKDFRATTMKLRIRNKRNTEVRIRANEVRRLAERRLGQLIIVLKDAGIVTDGRALPGYKAGRVPSRLTLKHDFDIDRKDSQDWQRLARMSEEAFVAFVVEETTRLRTPTTRLPAGPKIQSIALSSIESPPSKFRSLRPGKVDELAESMNERGQQQPIVLLPLGGGRYRRVFGQHRLEAARKLGWEKIDAIVRKGIDAVEAELLEIDENLIRADLTPAEQAAHQARRKELYEQKYPEAKKGAAGRGRKKSQIATSNEPAPAFIDDTARKTGKDRSTVARAVKRGNDIPNVAELAGTSLDQGAELDALAKLKEIDPERQAQLMEQAKAGEKVSTKAEIRARRKNDGRQSEPALSDRAPSLAPRPSPEQATGAAPEPVSQEPGSSHDGDAPAAQDLAPVAKAEAASPTAPDQAAPTPDLLDAASDRATPDDVLDADLLTNFEARREQKISLDEKLRNLIFLVECQINSLVSDMRAAGRLPELFRRVRKLTDKLEAEAAADGDQTEDCAESAAIGRATPTEEEMPSSPAA
jgi:ParB/RepB/Spo0J family partition protein